MICRRRFLHDTSRVVMGLTATPRLWHAAGRMRDAATPAAMLPDAIAPDVLRALALAAIGAAREAGASFADVRVGDERSFQVDAEGFGDARWMVGYGVRALVNGAWGVAHGDLLTTDAVVVSARDAVAAARANAAVNATIGARPIELPSLPATSGEWTSPVIVSPFGVPIDEHRRVLHALRRSLRPRYGYGSYGEIRWEAATRVLASTEGTLISQFFTRAVPRFRVVFDKRTYSPVDLPVPGLAPVLAGFEIVMDPQIPSWIEEAAEPLAPLSLLPMRPFEGEGRYPVVLDGYAMGDLAAVTLGQALDGDRVAGFEADAAGRSFLGVNSVGAVPFSPLLTLKGDRAAPAYTGTRWDDDGVAPAPTTLIEHGAVRGFLTTRESAANIGGGSASGGYACAPSPHSPPLSGGAHLSVASAAARRSLDDLVREISRGLLILGGRTWVEPGLNTGLFDGQLVFEVQNGRPVAFVDNVRCQFQTRSLWNSQLQALGDATTLRTTLTQTDKGMPWQKMTQAASTPAALFRDVAVRNLAIQPL